jgi:hypothetical protein
MAESYSFFFQCVSISCYLTEGTASLAVTFIQEGQSRFGRAALELW